VNHTGARTKPVRTHSFEAEVEEEEEEMDNQRMNGHDSSSEKVKRRDCRRNTNVTYWVSLVVLHM
jgi:hypothetical protein